MKSVLVTGGAKRIGKAISLSLAKCGYKIFIHYNNSHDDARLLKKQLNDEGFVAEIIQADLREIQQTEAVFKTLQTNNESIDILINCAASFYKDNADDFDASLASEQMIINSISPMILARDFSLQNNDSNSRQIINILDQKLWNMNPDFYSYTASKASLNAATDMMAMKFASKQIRVNALALGLILRSGNQTEESFKISHNRTPLGRGATLENVTEALNFIINSDWMTGQTIFVDCGEHLGFNG